MVGSAPHEAVVQAVPGLERFAALAQLLVALGKLPDAIGAVAEFA
jgi:hypothetical protein